MTNVSGTPQKRATRKGLFELGVQALEREGWKVSRIPRGGKASLRLISKGTERHKVSIRTSQDTWIAFPRKARTSGWVTLDDVDYVVAVSVNDRHNPTQACVHMIPGEDARARYDRAYEARKRAGHTLPIGRGIWLSLYDKEAAEPVSQVGAGMGLDYPALAVFDITKMGFSVSEEDSDVEAGSEEHGHGGRIAATDTEGPLTIPEAKRRLAKTLGVPESAIRITIEH